MEIVNRISQMQKISREWRKEGKTISLVPTMGFLHKGHLSLMEEGKIRGDYLITSIFVNPIQFGLEEDYGDYPRDLEQDCKLAKEVGVDVIFAPSVQEMYPKGFQTFVEVEKITETLCGICRPHHFQGVTTVVAKLFSIVNPHLAFFGKKDFQQFVTIKRMVLDLNWEINVIGMPIVREEDGLAMSSRNKYLSQDERRSALSLNRSLDLAKKLYQEGIRDTEKIERGVKRLIGEEKLAEIEYVKICNKVDLGEISQIKSEALLALAVKIGKTRLIDNCELGGEEQN